MRTLLAALTLATSVAAGFVSPANAVVTADNLKKLCLDSPKESWAEGMCLGYISGTYEALNEYNRVVNNGTKFCNGIRNVKISEIYTHSMEVLAANPSQSAAWIVVHGLESLCSQIHEESGK